MLYNPEMDFRLQRSPQMAESETRLDMRINAVISEAGTAYCFLSKNSGTITNSDKNTRRSVTLARSFIKSLFVEVLLYYNTDI